MWQAQEVICFCLSNIATTLRNAQHNDSQSDKANRQLQNYVLPFITIMLSNTDGLNQKKRLKCQHTK